VIAYGASFHEMHNHLVEWKKFLLLIF
jgi:hypothetical protein